MRKEQMFDWERKFYKERWERLKKVQKFIRTYPEVKDFTLETSDVRLQIIGRSLDDLHEVRKFLQDRISWSDKITNKVAYDNWLSVSYTGQDLYDFIQLYMRFKYTSLPEGILGPCHIETKETQIESYISTSKSIVCPLGD